MRKYQNKSIKHLFRLINILRTPYWRLISQYHLHYLFKQITVPNIQVISQDDHWKIIDINGFHFYWPVEYTNHSLDTLYLEVHAPAVKNPHAYEMGKIQVSEGDWVIDAGACEGFFTHYALSRKARVLAIEPVPLLAESLKLTFNDFICNGQLVVLNAGLEQFSGISQLQINTKDIFSSVLSKGLGQNISIISLDDILREKIIPTVDFIKMDIEGSEVGAIIGASNTIHQKRPKMAIAVYHAYENALRIQKIIKNINPDYRTFSRGIFVNEEYGLPRPYMLYAY